MVLEDRLEARSFLHVSCSHLLTSFWLVPPPRSNTHLLLLNNLRSPPHLSVAEGVWRLAFKDLVRALVLQQKCARLLRLDLQQRWRRRSRACAPRRVRSQRRAGRLG